MDSAAINKIILKYPGFLQSSKNESQFEGNIQLENEWFRLRITCPNFPLTRKIKLTVCSGLSAKTFDSSHFDPSWTLDRVLQELPSLMHKENQTIDVDYSSNLYNAHSEFLQLKSPLYKIHTNSKWDLIKFSEFDRFKGHYIQLRFNSIKELYLSDHSLPFGVQWEELFRTSHSVKSYLAQFLNFLEELRDFYTNLADIDELCFVVQPLNPTTKDDWRIFKLKDGVFVKLVLDPFTSSPTLVNLIGPTYEVESLRHVLSDGLKNWDSEMDVHSNLLRTFELTYFPMANEGTEKFCNICYCYQLEEQIPFISCDNRSCNLVYHAMCLKEWFTMLADGKVFLDVAFGACPFCKEKLSTSFADMLR